MNVEGLRTKNRLDAASTKERSPPHHLPLARTVSCSKSASATVSPALCLVERYLRPGLPSPATRTGSSPGLRFPRKGTPRCRLHEPRPGLRFLATGRWGGLRGRCLPDSRLLLGRHFLLRRDLLELLHQSRRQYREYYVLGIGEYGYPRTGLEVGYAEVFAHRYGGYIQLQVVGDLRGQALHLYLPKVMLKSASRPQADRLLFAQDSYR